MNETKLRGNYYNYVGNVKEIGEVVEKAAQIWPDKIAFYHNKREKTYRQFRDDVAVLENILVTRGIKKSDRVALVCENSYEWVIVFFAVIGVGAVVVPIDIEIPIEKISALVDENCIENIICSAKYSSLADTSNASILNIEALYDQVSNYIGEPVFNKNYEFNENDICQMSFTSGTTGKMKAVLLSSKNIISDAIGTSKIINADPHIKLLIVLPFNHMFTIVASLIIPIMRGAEMFISSGRKYFLREIMQFKPSWLIAVPAIVATVMKVASSSISSGNNPEMFSAIKELSCIICGGAALDPKYIGLFEKFGVVLVNGYGITECSPIISVNYPDHNIPGSCGFPIDNCVIHIHAPDADGAGDIYVKGDNVFSGYADKKDNEGIFEDGWFITGDIGRLGEDGALYITGRKKNLIIMENGKNVSSEELENFLMDQINGIEEVVVKGENGVIAAYIFTLQDNYDEIKSKILDINKQLASYKQIRKVEFRKEPFAKTSTMKIIRK